MSSTRSSSLTRVSSSRRGASSNDFLRQLGDNILPTLVLVAVVVALVIGYIAGPYYDAKTENWWEIFKNTMVAGVGLTVALGAAAWVTAMCYMHADQSTRMLVLGLFAAAAVLLVIAAWMYFRRSDQRHVAFYLVLAALVALAVHTYLCFREDGVMALAGMALLVFVVAYCVYKFWPDGC